MDSQSPQPPVAMCTLGSRMSEAGTQFLLRQPQLSVPVPLVLDPYAEIRHDPSDHIDTHTPTQAGRTSEANRASAHQPAHHLKPLF